MDNPKKISAEEAEQLFAFIRKHYVEYYDVQCELTDHMANAIEEQWVQNPGLSFEEALKIEFKKFGVFGFMGIVEQRQRALNKKYTKLLKGYFKEFFRLPKILLTMLLFFCVYKVVEYNEIAYLVLMMATGVFNVYKGIALNRVYKKKIGLTGKKWMLEEIIKGGGRGGSILFITSFLLPTEYGEHPSLIAMLLISVIFTACLLFQYIILYVIPSRAEEHLLKTYPEYNM